MSKEKEKTKPFNADPITLDNWEGFVKCRKKPIHAVQMNFPGRREISM